MVNFKQIIEKFNTDKVFKKKVLTAGAMAIGSILFIIFMANKETPNDVEKQKEVANKEAPVDDYFIADTSKIVDDKNQIYQYGEKPTTNGSEINLGKVEGQEGSDNAEIDAYMKKREYSLQKMNNSYTPQRRPYNPTPNIQPQRREVTFQESQPYNTVQETPKPVVAQEQPKPKTLEDIIRSKNQGGKSATSSNTIRVAIHSNQKISSTNTTVKLRLLEPIVINGQTIGTDQFIYAKASMGNNAINLYVDNINYNNTILPVGMWAYDNKTGNKGIEVENDDIISTSAQKVVENKSNGLISKYGGEIGGAIRDIFSGRNKQQTIQLVNETYLILKKDK